MTSSICWVWLAASAFTNPINSGTQLLVRYVNTSYTFSKQSLTTHTGKFIYLKVAVRALAIILETGAMESTAVLLLEDFFILC